MTNPAWNRRRTAAKKYQPKRVRLLIVAESPPADEELYFYFEGAEHDPLFEEVAAVLFEVLPHDKVAALKELRRRGVFVVELKPDGPRAGEPMAQYVTPFLLNVDTYAPEKIVLLGDAYAALHQPMTRSELPVVDVNVPAPDAGVEFRQKLRQALVRAELEKLIRPLKKSGD